MERPEEEKKIKRILLDARERLDVNGFGVVLGPTGTIKSFLITKVCQQNPNGVIYIHMSVMDALAKDLANAVGMKLHPMAFDHIVTTKF